MKTAAIFFAQAASDRLYPVRLRLPLRSQQICENGENERTGSGRRTRDPKAAIFRPGYGFSLKKGRAATPNAVAVNVKTGIRHFGGDEAVNGNRRSQNGSEWKGQRGKADEKLRSNRKIPPKHVGFILKVLH